MSVHDELRTILKSQWRATASGPYFEIADPPKEFFQAFPEDYLSVIEEFGGREGFLGCDYMRLYRLPELVALNVAYEVPFRLPELLIFGSNGGGEAFAFSLVEPGVLQVPFVPMTVRYVNRLSQNFSQFIHGLASSGKSPAQTSEAVGHEVHELTPICFGGSPTDPTNKALVPVVQHAKLCRYWNKVYRSVVERQRERKG